MRPEWTLAPKRSSRVALNETNQLFSGLGIYPVDLHDIAAWLADHSIKRVAMERTAV
jgi:hypothetical protein